MNSFYYRLVILAFFLGLPSLVLSQDQLVSEKNEYVKLSMKLLAAVKNEDEVDKLKDKVETLSLADLGQSLKTDIEKKAFWINIYNAYVQILLSNDPSLFEDRGSFFKDDRILIGGEMFSFDFIEHGVIRGSKVKLSMGFLKDPFAGELERQFRVEETDGRIHFALNCGAKSCPYVAIYSSYDLENELDAIAEQFLKRTTTFDEKTNEVEVTTLFSWFKGDFSSKGGVIGYLKHYGVIPQDADPSIEYQDYDWTLSLGNYTELSIKN